VTRGLVARGYSDEAIRKILGENWLRVFEQVWKK
jgi:membrane dipeptidase